eukprot:COSAG03_NODE_12346_length_551_cov_1.079646_1_plen_126_part_01
MSRPGTSASSRRPGSAVSFEALPIDDQLGLVVGFEVATPQREESGTPVQQLDDLDSTAEKKVAEAVDFLKDPNNEAAPLDNKLRYLREKFKMSDSEVDIALRRAGGTSVASAERDPDAVSEASAAT